MLLTTGSRRRQREQRTIEAMIAIFCQDHHASKDHLCPECAALAAYARERLEKCPFGDDKPTCVKCPIHCYKPARREDIQNVMRFAGPRILLRRPILAIRHMLDERRVPPEHPRRQSKRSNLQTGGPPSSRG
jgi:hypothetical protein